ncbi:MAG TPA: ABC transporter ATP-binding protein [Candidatus Acidoferrum sp.]
MTTSPATIPFAQYRRAFQFVAPYWRSLMLVMALGLLSTAISLAQPYISRLLIDDALLRHNMRALGEIAGLMAGITIVGFAINIASSYRYVRLSAECLFDMRLAVYRHLQRLSPRFFAKTKLGDIVSRINNDIGEVQRICSDTLLSVLSNALFLVGSLAMMAYLNWRLFFASIALLPVSVVALRHYQKRLTTETKTLRERSSDLGSFLIESLLAMRLIVATGNEHREAEEFRRRNSRFLQSLLSMQMMAFLASALPGAVLAISTAVVFLYGGKLVIDSQLTLGGLVAFMAYHLRLLGPVQVMLGTYTNLLTGGVALGRVFEIMDVPVEVRESRSPTACASLRGDIAFERVRFRFSSDVPVLEDVSFHIAAGTLCTIVGASGSGKSTLADLLLRFYDPDSGSITVDGLDLRTLCLQDLRREIALVEQTPFLFHATVRENIAYGKPTAKNDEIRAAARAANIDDFIQSLPERYDTIVGERGCTVSAGERQRISLARALLRNPSILVMDEPTAALDPGSEAAIARALSGTLRGRTVIVITHRVSLVEIADHVVVLDGGRIVEDGAPQQLLSSTNPLSRQFRLANARVTGTP